MLRHGLPWLPESSEPAAERRAKLFEVTSEDGWVRGVFGLPFHPAQRLGIGVPCLGPFGVAHHRGRQAVSLVGNLTVELARVAGQHYCS